MIISYITWAPDPEIFRIGSLAIRWYGVLFALGFVTGYFIIQHFFKKENIPVKLLDQLTTVMVIATIIGARLGHCLFYEPAYYLKNPIDILKIWEGGLASHGAAIAIIIGIWYFSRRNKISFWRMIDRIAVVTALAGFLSAWATWPILRFSANPPICPGDSFSSMPAMFPCPPSPGTPVRSMRDWPIC
jgi:phosphatidylglycerol---prolipoprotein diacylglyceryl transferase